MSKINLEICAYNIQSAINAQTAGADRVELCDNFSEGGTTPGYGTMVLARKNLSIKLHLLIRPRGGDFYYSPVEFETIIKDIEVAKYIGADGIAVGILNSDGIVDSERMKIIMEAAYPMSVTFHRAFDCVLDPFKSLDVLMELGISRVLTSGLKNSVPEGIEMISRLVDYAKDRIIIMPGGGINHENIGKIFYSTGASEYHMSGKSVAASKMEFINNDISFNSDRELGLGYIETDIIKIKKTVEILKTLTHKGVK